MRKDEWRRWNTFLFDGDPALAIHQGREIFLSIRRLEDDRMPGNKSEHSFEMQDQRPPLNLKTHQERFRGTLSNIFLPFIRQDEKQGMRRMARQLKRYVEHREYRQYRRDQRARRDC